MQPPSAAPALTARIADFLRTYPPFSYLTEEQLGQVSRSAVVKYLPPQASVFAQGDEPLQRFFVVNKGAIRLFRTDDTLRLVDQLDEGDVFGIRPLIAKQRYAVTARASEESLLYAIAIADFEPLIEANPQVARFLTQSFAAGVRNPLKQQDPGRTLIEAEALQEVNATYNERREQLLDQTRITINRKAVRCKSTSTVQAAAVKMSRAGVGSIVITDGKKRPLGILTDRDLRRMVVTGLYSSEEPVAEIMSTPVVTVRPDPRVVEVQLSMLRHRISHLVVTADGTPASKVLGVLTNRDLLLALGNSPAAIVAEIERAGDGAELSRLRLRAEQWLRPIVDQRGSVYSAAKIMTEVNDHISRRCITLSLEAMKVEGIEAPALAFCWLSLGSQARGEQLLRTDQDHALVLADGTPEVLAKAKPFYVELGLRVSAALADIGFERCVGDMMAANPNWCLSLAEWETQLSEWVKSPNGANLLNASTLLDRRPLAGDMELGQRLVSQTVRTVAGESLFLAFLAKAAVDNPPPLSFFRSFLVESSGEHKDDFDIKQRAMLSLADAARVLTLSVESPDPPNTIDRYDRLREKEPRNAEIYHAAAQAYDTLMLFRARQGLSDGTDGRYFKIRELSKLERLQLRNTFGPIDDLLNILKMRFSLQMLSQ